MKKGPSTELLESWLPDFDFVEQHAIMIRSDPSLVYETVRDLDFRDVPVIRALFALRSLPGLLQRPAKKLGMTLQDLEKSGFRILDEKPAEELVIGVIGKFWKPSGQIVSFQADRFRSFQESGFAKGAWNFRVDQAEDGCRLSTETRVRCLGEDARRQFGRYWFFIGPFSGLIRTAMLKAIRKKVERP